MVHSELGNTSSSLSCSPQIVHLLKSLRCQIASVSATFKRVRVMLSCSVDICKSQYWMGYTQDPADVWHLILEV